MAVYTPPNHTTGHYPLFKPLKCFRATIKYYANSWNMARDIDIVDIFTSTVIDSYLEMQGYSMTGNILPIDRLLRVENVYRIMLLRNALSLHIND